MGQLQQQVPQPGASLAAHGTRLRRTTMVGFAQFTAGAAFPKIQFFPLLLEHCILFNPSPVTPAPALFQLDSKNNLFIHTAHAIISSYSSGRRGVIPLSRNEITEY